MRWYNKPKKTAKIAKLGHRRLRSIRRNFVYRIAALMSLPACYSGATRKFVERECVDYSHHDLVDSMACTLKIIDEISLPVLDGPSSKEFLMLKCNDALKGRYVSVSHDEPLPWRPNIVVDEAVGRDQMIIMSHPVPYPHDADQIIKMIENKELVVTTNLERGFVSLDKNEGSGQEQF